MTNHGAENGSRPSPDRGERHGTGHLVTGDEDAGTVVRQRLPGGDDGLPVTVEARLLEVVADRVPVVVPRVVRDMALGHLTGIDDGVVARSTFYARARALEDLRFGADSGLPVYQRNAARAIGALFGTATSG